MKKMLSLFFCVLLFQLQAQNPNRIFYDFQELDNVFKVEVNDGYYLIQFYNDKIVQTSFIPDGESFHHDSHAIIMKPKSLSIQAQESADKIELKSNQMRVEIKKSPFQISYFDQNNLIISEKAGYKKDSLEKIQFNLKPDEILFGGGARALGMNRRGHRLELYNRAHYGYETYSELMNYTMPIVVSSAQYLIHFDNAPIGFLDLDSQNNNTLEYQSISGRKTYQIVIGDDWENMIQQYTKLTGRQPLLPRWSLGNFASRFGYRSQNEVLSTAQKFRDENVPLDAIILDLYWFGKEVHGPMGNLAFDKDSFPQPQKMINDLRRNKVETILISEPFILTTSNRWQEAVNKDVLAKDSVGNPYTYDFFFGNTGLVDLYSNKGYKWFKDIYIDLLQMGVTGMWGDLGEPEVHPSDLLHATGTADEVHNIYGHDWARLVQDAFHKETPNLRPFILMRAAYSGSQRYGIIPWTGDVNRTWGGLQSQPEIALQMGLQGIGYMHSDLGGFAGDNLDDELYVRWLQYGVFQPIYRPHAQEEVPSEPVFRSKSALDLSRKAIDLRYQMLPYNYNLMFENHLTGKPLMRPLFFEDTDNLELFEYSESYLWGDDFLISPILYPNQKRQTVYFPKNSDWIDFYTLKKYKGGSKVDIRTKKEYIPTFVRAGAIIPLAPKMQSTKEYKGDNLILHYYFDEEIKNSQTQIYNDDGLLSDAFIDDKYELLNFSSKVESNNIELTLQADLGENFEAGIKKITWVLHGLTKEPETIKMNGKSYNVPWKRKSKTLKIESLWDPTEIKTIQILLKD